MRSPDPTTEEKLALAFLERRLGRFYVKQRLGLEEEFEAQDVRKETWYSLHSLIRAGLRLAGLHRRGRRNALAIEVRTNEVPIQNLPPAFDGFTILHLSDLHLDINAEVLDVLIERVSRVKYDLCVLTGDYRARTFGAFDAVLKGLERLRPAIKTSAYAVLGNHDTIRLVPTMEAMGYRLLLNEWTKLVCKGEVIYLAGIDDAHKYRMEDFHRAAHDIPTPAVSLLLSHTPETYKHAAHAGFDLMLCGHTHGGQICLPGGMPVLKGADIPRALARGRWSYHGMSGYTSPGAGTSIVDVRLNCPPEITLHKLRQADTLVERAPDAATWHDDTPRGHLTH